MKKEIVCGRENLKEFRGILKQRFPEFFLLAKALYEAGMIEGLRGMKITPVYETSEKTVKTAESVKKPEVCRDCSQWHKDLIGDGHGAGKCDLNMHPRTSKYPTTTACDCYGKKADD